MTARILTIFLLTLSFAAGAQTYPYSLLHSQQDRLESAVLKADTFFHTAFRPYRMEQLQVLQGQPWADSSRYNTKSKFLNTLLNRDWVNIEEEKFLKMRINPIINAEVGMQAAPSKSLFVNTRGVIVQGELGKKVGFETGFAENQAVFADYIDAEARNNGFVGGKSVIPQQGMYKKYGNNGFDFSYAFGHLSYSPSKYFNIQIGHGKQFIGDGYRSLLLSDNTFFYPYVKLTTQIGRFQYTNLFTEFQNLNDANRNILGRGFDKKHASYHYLSTFIGERLQVGIFESIVWQATDSSGYRRGLDVNYFNPIIFFRPVEFSLGSPDNALLGLNLRYNFPQVGYLYGQMLLDDINASDFLKTKKLGHINNKIAWQLGFKWINVGKIQGLNWRNEINIVRPYTYSHRMVAQNYTHFSQPLAHPLGANFREFISIATYQKKRWQATGKVMLAKYGEDRTDVADGRNPFMSSNEALPYIKENGNKMFQGIATDLTYMEGSVKYVLNPVNQLGIELRIAQRNLQPTGSAKQSTTIFSIALANLPINRYYDF